MNSFDKYQIEARKTAIYPDVGHNLWYPALGLGGEAGEVQEKIKKIYRDKKGIVSTEDALEICKELGDELWYLANIAAELGVSLSQIAHNNMVKLQSRQNRSVVHGAGDNR
jgi:NTP pyrophosphatase (non-canonical NTP hydrolase)